MVTILSCADEFWLKTLFRVLVLSGSINSPEASTYRQRASGIMFTSPSESVTYPEIPAVSVQASAVVIAAEV